MVMQVSTMKRHLLVVIVRYRKRYWLARQGMPTTNISSIEQSLTSWCIDPQSDIIDVVPADRSGVVVVIMRTESYHVPFVP